MWRQEDAHEYMRYLIEALHNCCLPAGVATNSPTAQERSLVYKIFGGRLRSQVKCTVCSQCSNTYDPFLDLSLEIVRAETLTKALERFTAVEALEGDNKYHCSNCKKKVRALKQFTVDKAPNILTIQFKRFSSTGSSGGKIDKRIEFGRTLDLKPFISNPQDSNAKYTLYAVLVHSGWSTHSGHYYCFVRTASDMWHALDDSRVRQVSERSVLDQKAYILFYIRDAAIKCSPGLEQSMLSSSLPTCKQLLSDGAAETTDDVDTATDEADGNESHLSRECGARNVAAGGEGALDGAGSGQMSAMPNCCPRFRAAGNTQTTSMIEKVENGPGIETLACPSNGEAETSIKPVEVKFVAETSVDCSSAGSDPLKEIASAEDTKEGSGTGDCSTSGKVEEGDDWDDYYKKCGHATSHSYLRLLHAMPRTRRYFLARALPIQKERKRVAVKGQGQFEHGKDDVLPSVANHSRKDLKRPGSVNGEYVVGKKQKDGFGTLPTVVSVQAAAPKSTAIRGCINGFGPEHTNLSREMMEEDGTAHRIELLGDASAMGVAQSVQAGNGGKENIRESFDATTGGSPVLVNVGLHQQSGDLAKVAGEDSEVRVRSGSLCTDRCEGDIYIRASHNLELGSEKVCGVTGFGTAALQTEGLYGIGVPCWSAVEVSGHAAVKDIDLLLQPEKVLRSKLDAWDEEYDRGKVKKVRNRGKFDKQSPFSEVGEVATSVNPFQVLSTAKQQPIDDVHGRGPRQTACGFRSVGAHERRG